MSSENMKRIVWLASYPKSGNTWLRMFLQVYMTGVKCDINSPYRVMYKDTDGLAYRSVCPMPLPCDNPDVMMGVRYAALLHLVQKHEGGDAILKTHSIAASNQDGLYLCPPSLTKMAVYLIRDPRDILVSFAHHLSQSIDDTIDLMCHKQGHLKDKLLGFGHHMSSWGNHASCWVANDKFPVCVVRYERMINKTRETFKSIVKFLFGNVDEERLDLAISETSFDTLQQQEIKTGFNEQKGKELFFRIGESGRWKVILTTEQVTRLEAGIGEAMERMSYKCVTRDIELPEVVS